jgi:hypothetical protein
MSDDPKKDGAPSALAVNRARLATARGRRKLDVILDAPDPRAFVRQLPAEDLYFAIRDIGLEDAIEVVGLASPGQFRSFVDLDAWDGGVPDPQRVLQWLELAARARASDFRTKRAGLDAELILSVLKAFTIVHSLEEEEDPVLTSSNYLRTAEGKYVVEITAEDATGITVRRLIEDFIAEDPFTATRLFEAVRWESTAELEETALRWRTGRLRDMGFPEFEEAIRIWSPPPAGWMPHSSPVDLGPIAGVPALLLTASTGPLFLDRVVERLPDTNRPLFNEGLIYLLNCAIVADGIEPRALDLARDTLTATRDMLSLGLELSADGDEEKALAILGSTPPVELFRVAVGRVRALAREAAEAAKPVSFGTAGATALDPPESEIVAGLRRKRPQFYDPAPPGSPPRREGDRRAYRSRADLAAAEAVLQRVRALGAALGVLGLDAAGVVALAEASGRATTAVTVGQILLTAAVEGSPRVTPIPAGELSRLCGLFQGGHLTVDARQRLDAWWTRTGASLAEPLRPGFRELGARFISRLEEELGPPCAAGGLDARFVDCLLVAG